jgi:hypothetical protein
MIVAVLHNLRSRALRTALTVGGIAIGIIALVVAGSLAERLQTSVGRSNALNGNAIFALSTSFGRDRSSESADALNRAGPTTTGEHPPLTRSTAARRMSGRSMHEKIPRRCNPRRKG